MHKPQFFRMQLQTVRRGQGIAIGIKSITQYRVANCQHMNTQLMCTPCARE